MIARTTLALMLACLAATAVLTAPHHAAAESRKSCRDCSSHPTQNIAYARRIRTDRSLARRSLDAACTTLTSRGVCDDGLAYDTPRDASGHPLDEAALIPLAAVGPEAGRASSNPWQTGVASWYGGSRWQGHLTSSGTRYDENGLTAAHASLPLGSLARVRLVGSEREVVVTITDRPGTRSRVIDLSRGAAAKLGILSQGVARVAIDPL